MRKLVECVWPGTKTARKALEESRAGDEHVDRLVRDLRHLQQENHFSQALDRTLGGR